MATQTYRYRLTKTEWMAASLLWMRRKPLIFVNTAIAVFWLVTAIVMCSLLLFQAVRAHVAMAQLLLNLAVFIVMVAGFGGLAFYRIRREVKRSMQPDWGKEVILSFEDEMLVASFPGVSETRYFWGSIPKLVESKRFGLIYSSRTNCIAFPKRAVPAKALASLNAAISESKMAR